MMPWLKYVPAWVPGAGFKTTAVKYKGVCDQLGEKPLGWLKEKMACALNRFCSLSLANTGLVILGKRRS